MKKKIIIPLIAAIILFTGTAFKSDFFEIAKQIEIFTTMYKELNMNYVDETNPGDLMNTAIKNMLNDLDPYTVFMNEQDIEAARINNTGDYTGIGAIVKTLKDKLLIVEPYKDYPADAAGLKAAMRAVPIFLAEQVEARVCMLPEGHDPDTFIGEHGAEVLELELKNATTLPEFVFDHLSAEHGMGLEGKAKIAAELNSLAKELDDNQYQKTIFTSHFSQKLGIPLDQMDKGVSSAAKKLPGKTEKVEKDAPIDLPLKQKQLLEFLIIFPEYLQKFLEAGIEEVVDSSVGQNILQHLKEFTRGEGGSLEQLLDLADGPERAFISRLLISSPSYSDEDRDEAAMEKLNWLQKNRLKETRERLTEQINVAQREGNIELCMELIARKNSLDK